MKIAWTNTLQGEGIAYGYSNHQNQLRTALINNGVIFDDNADVQVSIVPANNFRRVEGKFNVLYTMYEATDIPPSWIPKLKGADLIVVPCEHNKRLFRKYTDKPIEVCLEGVLTDKFTYVERSFPEKLLFRFLWFGASNERKGYKHMIVAWRYFQIKYPDIAVNCELYMKTTQNTEGERIAGYKDGQPVKKTMPKERVFRAENAIVDTRKVSEEELAKIYHDAHAFVFPTMGEGFGLTLAEAMSTGLPCIYTPWSGPCDFISDKEGYPVKYGMTKVFTHIARLDGNHEKECETWAASPDIEDIVQNMVFLYSTYTHGHSYKIGKRGKKVKYYNALERGKRAADRIRKEITWDISANRFMDIIRSYVDG